MGTHKAPQEVLRSLKAAGGTWITAGHPSLHHFLSQTNQKLKQQEEIVCFGSREIEIQSIVAVTNEWRQKDIKEKCHSNCITFSIIAQGFVFCCTVRLRIIELITILFQLALKSRLPLVSSKNAKEDEKRSL